VGKTTTTSNAPSSKSRFAFFRPFILIALSLAVVVQLLLPLSVFAATIDWSNRSEATIKKAKELELVYTMVNFCGEKTGSSAGNILDFDFQDTVQVGTESKGHFLVDDARSLGKQISPFAATLIKDDVSPNCSDLAPAAAKALSPDGTLEGFMKIFYEEDGAEAIWELKDDYKDHNDAFTKLMDLADDKGMVNGNGAISHPFMYRWYSMRGPKDEGAFTKCFKKVGDGAVDGGLFTLKHEESGKQSTWKYIDNDTKGKTFNVGYLNDDRIGDFDDGKWRCDEFANFIKAKTSSFGILGLSNAELAAYLDSGEQGEQESTKLEDLKTLLGNSVNNAILTGCIAKSGDDGLQNIAIADIVPPLAASIIDNTDTFNISVITGAAGQRGTRPVNALSTAAIKICLADSPIGAKITEIAGREFVPSGSLDDASSDDAEDVAADDCDGIIPGGVLNKINPAAYLRNALDWFGCSFSKGLVSIIDKMSDVISSSLATSEDDTQKAAIQEVWSKFLTIANVLFVLAFLLMTISTALNIGIFDAYTVKKLLPRIIIAALIANLSFPLCYLVINMTNIMGGGVYAMITSLTPSSAGSLGTGPGVALSGGIAAGVGAAIVGIATGGIFAVIPALLAALFGIFITYSIVLIRRILILLLIVMSPIAAVLWVLPGGDGLAKRWWKTFIQMLMVYPLIMGFIAAGQLASNITLISATKNGANDAGFFEGITSLLLIVLPLFMLPAVFKMATSTIANLTGMINDKGKGLIDRSKKLRGQKMAEGWEGIKSGNRFKGGNESNRRGRWNKSLQTASLAGAGGWDPRRRKDKIESERARRDFDTAKKLGENSAFEVIANDDDKLWAYRHGGGDLESVKEQLLKRAPGRFRRSDPSTLNRAAEEIMRAKRESGTQAGMIASGLAQAGSGTGYDYNEDVEDNWMDDLIGIAPDRTTAGRMMAPMAKAGMGSGRIDLFGGGFAKRMTVLDQRREALSNKELGLGEVAARRDDRGRMLNTAGDVVENYEEAEMINMTQQDAKREIHRDVLASHGGGVLAYKKRAVEELAPVMVENLDTALKSGDVAQGMRALATAAGRQDTAAQVAPQNAEVHATQVLGQQIDVAGLSPEMRAKLGVEEGESITYGQAINRVRDDLDFNTMRREYGAAAGAQITAEQAAIAAGLAQGGAAVPPPVIPPMSG
jgi:hypothetical protein